LRHGGYARAASSQEGIGLHSHHHHHKAAPLDAPRPATVLETIGDPWDLRGLDHAQLEELAAELRELIIRAVNEHGGHLGSNLGVVELTIALHRVFTSPHDVILWDTGHQAYVHKLLTGRAKHFERLRQAGGLSGYPSRDESAHDWVENSHASTALSYAQGMGLAMRLQGTPERKVVAVVGDGSLTGGVAFEGLNNLGHTASDCIIVFNDNGRSYAPTVSRLGASLRRPGPDGAGTGAAPSGFFEALGVAYHGPVDGHDVAVLETALRAAAARSGPQVLHVITEKGRGYPPAENDPVKRLHDTSRAHPDSYTAHFGQALTELAAEYPQLVAITAAMPDSTGLLPFGRRFPDRFIDVGIAEQHAVTAAAGMAMQGLVPVVAIYSTFLTRAIDQVVHDVALHRLPVIFCLDRAGITGDDGPSHHGVLDLALLSKVPGMTIFAPSSLAELRIMLRDAVAVATGPDPHPVAIRWSKTVPTAGLAAPTGSGTRAPRVRHGDDVCLIAVGKMVDASMEAADLLAREHISVTVWDPRCVAPLDAVMLRDAARHRAVVTLEDGVREGGIGAAVVSRLLALPPEPAVRGARPVRPEVLQLGTPLEFIPHGKVDAIHAVLGLGPDGIAEQVLALVHRDLHDIRTAGAT
jgi:1-deoxy-D-xylulose-5-phosphate synthase